MFKLLDELREAAKKRCLKALTDGTKIAYKRTILIYKNFCKKFNFIFLRPTLDCIIIFTEWLISKAKVQGSVLNHLSALKFYFSVNFMSTDIFDNFLLKLLLKGLKASLPVRMRTPVVLSPFLLKRMILMTSSFGSARYVIALAMILGYFGLLRVSNYLVYASNKFDKNKNLTFNDVSIIDEKFIVKLKWTKTRQNNEITYVVLPCIDDPILSPFHHFRKMLKFRSNLSMNDSPLLLLPSGLPLTVHYFNKVLKCLARKVIGNDTVVGSHTLRRSGTTYLSYAGATDSQLMQQGTWTSACFRKYILSNVLQPSPVQDAVNRLLC
jgi:hypothetical protein